MNAILKKLQYKGQVPALVMNAPKEYEKNLKDMTEMPDLTIKGKYPFIHLFVKNSIDLKAVLKDVLKAVEGDGLCWISYPKGSSKKYRSDLNRDGLWAKAQKQGFDAVALIAIDNDWSAMRLRKAEFVGK